MSLEELNLKYTDDELRRIPGDALLRFNILSPILMDLHESKVVYRERFVCVVSLQDVEISPTGFRATCRPFHPIDPEPASNPKLLDKWRCSSSWELMGVGVNSIGSPWAGWTIWPEKDLVKEVIQLASAGKFQSVRALLAK